MYRKIIKYAIACAVAIPFVSLSAVRNFGGTEGAVSQDMIPVVDSLQIGGRTLDTLRGGNDSLDLQGDALFVDSLLLDSMQKTYHLADSLRKANDTVRPPKKKFLDAPIHGTSKDSLVYDVKNKTISVYAQGDIKYQTMGLKAEYIEINTSNKNVRAEGRVLDTIKKEYKRPVFSEGQQTYDVDSMDYNMESGKGLIEGVNTKDGEGFIYGGTVKKMKDNTVHMHNGRYTVCDATCPHFYLQMTKGTTVPGKQTVFGPSYMVFEDVPIYFLGLPFGFFPQSRERAHGIIFPEIGEEYIKGFFIRNLGYYVPIGEYVDLRVLGGFYTLGSWQVGAGANYALRYKFNGNISFDYASDKIGDKDSPDYIEQTNIALRWTHTQNAKFLPGTTFAASVNYTSSNYNKFNAQNINDYLNTQTSSSINFSKSWAGLPISLAINADMSQNSRDSTVTMNLPNVAFNVTRVAPFKRRPEKAIGKERWYEKISFTYNLNFKSEANRIKESELFKPEMFEQMRLGVQHNLPISATFNAFNYLNITPQISYGERWYFRRIDQHWDAENEKVVQDTTRGFNRLWNVSASVGLSTKLFGTYTVGRGLRKKPAIFRHVFTPSVSGSFTPDNGSRYYSTVQTDNTGENIREYSPWAQELYGTPSRGRSASMSVSLNNTLEAKFPSMKDSTGYKKVKLIEQLNIGASYNFIADSMNLSNISVGLSTNLFNKLPINISASFDPYAVDKNGNRINKFLVSEGKFLRLASLSFSLGYSFSSKASRSSGQPAVNNPLNNTNDRDMAERAASNNFFENNPEQRSSAMSQRELAAFAATQYYDFNIPWNVGFSYSFSYSDYGRGPTTQQSINVNASTNITQKWAVSGSAGYDFVMKKLTPGSVRITRDLHCWQMSLQWVPIGFRQSWSFNIAVKSAMLSDMLKYDKNNSFLDNYYRR